MFIVLYFVYNIFMKKEKNRLTTFNISTSHVIQTTFLFPIVWLLIGSFSKMILNEKNILPIEILSTIYYVVLFLSFYWGAKHSISYINKKIIISQPKEASRQSILWFIFGAIIVNYAFYYFEKDINYIRIFTTILIIIMFVKITIKYFNSIEADTQYLEYTFPFQIVILLANLSLIIMLFMLYGIYNKIVKFQILIMPILIIFIFILQGKINIFLPFFHKKEEIPNLKKPIIYLAITLPINIVLFLLIIKYFQD